MELIIQKVLYFVLERFADIIAEKCIEFGLNKLIEMLTKNKKLHKLKKRFKRFLKHKRKDLTNIIHSCSKWLNSHSTTK